MTNQLHSDSFSADEAEIDLLARRAGSDVRRSAPDDVVSSIRRARRTQQVTRTVLAGTGAIALVAGVLFLGSRFGSGEDQDPVISNPVAPTTVAAPPATSAVPDTTNAVAPSTVANDPTPTTSLPTDDGLPTPAPAAGGASEQPPALYRKNTPPDATVREQEVLDPSTGEKTGTQPLAPFAPQYISSEAVSANGTKYIAGGAIVDFDYEFPTYEINLCGQIRHRLPEPTPAGFPEWSSQLALSADGEAGFLITAECPEEGRIIDEFGTRSDGKERGTPMAPYNRTVWLFDPNQPGDAGGMTKLFDLTPDVLDFKFGFSDDHRWLVVALEVADGASSTRDIRVIDTTTATVSSVDLGECSIVSLTQSMNEAWSDLPVIGSSISYVAECGDQTIGMLYDLASGAKVELAAPDGTSGVRSVEVARSGFGSIETAWTLTCGVLPTDAGALPRGRCVARSGTETVTTIDYESGQPISFEPIPVVGD